MFHSDNRREGTEELNVNCQHEHSYMKISENEDVWVCCDLCEKVRMVIPLVVRPHRRRLRHRILTFTQEFEHCFQDVEEYAEMLQSVGHKALRNKQNPKSANSGDGHPRPLTHSPLTALSDLLASIPFPHPGERC